MLSFVEHGRHSTKCGQARVDWSPTGEGLVFFFVVKGYITPYHPMGLAVHLPTFIVNVYGKCR